MMTEQFAVTGMTCAACSSHVEKAVSRLSGVQSAPVNLMLGSMTVTYDEKAVTEGDIIAAVKAAGYGASPALSLIHILPSLSQLYGASPCASIA